MLIKTNISRFTLVVTAISANANTDTVKKQAFKSANLKHKIQILFAGINDQKEKEAPQPTNNDDVEDKDREGKMRSKGKSEPPKVKRVSCDYSCVFQFTISG